MVYTPLFEQREPLRLELEYLINSLLADKPPHPSGKEGLKVLKICEAALKSAQIHLPVSLS